jgi:hypothetical protein
MKGRVQWLVPKGPPEVALMPLVDFLLQEQAKGAGRWPRVGVETFEEHVERRCEGTAGHWCGEYLRQTLIPWKVTPVPNPLL